MNNVSTKVRANEFKLNLNTVEKNSRRPSKDHDDGAIKIKDYLVKLKCIDPD